MCNAWCKNAYRKRVKSLINLQACIAHAIGNEQHLRRRARSSSFNGLDRVRDDVGAELSFGERSAEIELDTP